MTFLKHNHVSLRQLSDKTLAFLVSLLLVFVLAAPFAPATTVLAENTSSNKSSVTDEPKLTEATTAIVTDAQGKRSLEQKSRSRASYGIHYQGYDRNCCA